MPHFEHRSLEVYDMKSGAIEQAQLALEQAGEAALAFATETEPREFEKQWSAFLMAASRFYAKLEQGAKSHSKSMAWYGQRKGERRADPLLRYIHHARNIDHHGLVKVTGSKRGKLHFHAPEEGVQMTHHGDNVRFTNVSGEPITVDYVRPHFVLETVVDSGVPYAPPTAHLGETIEPFPSQVATATIAYMTAMLAEARTKLPVID